MAIPESQITAMCWGLAHAYQATLNTTPTPMMGPAARPLNQLVQVSVTLYERISNEYENRLVW